MSTPTMVPMLAYEDGAAAMDWLVRAFGFEEVTRWLSDDGVLEHGELRHGDGVVMLATPSPAYEGPARHRTHCPAAEAWLSSPYVVDGVLVHVADVEAHRATAEAAGATMLSGIEQGPPGRLYRAEDLEGHRWMFLQSQRVLTPVSEDDAAVEDTGAVGSTGAVDGQQPGGDPRLFVDTDLGGARFVRANLSRAVMRGVDVAGADIDAPWLLEGGNSLWVNGVDVVPFVAAELDRRLPGRARRTAQDPEGLREAWADLEHTWAGTMERVAAMPEGTVDVSVDGEWSFSQTLRHLVMATDTWLGRAVLERAEPYHPLGQPHAEYELDGYDPSVFVSTVPPYAEVLEVRAEKVALVRDFLASVTAADLAVRRRNPWAPQHPETTLSCLHTILEEEWEHHRYAVRDLDAIESTSRP